MYKVEYLTQDYEHRTKYQSVRDAIDRDQFSVVCTASGIWIEPRQCPQSIFRRVRDELRSLYPSLHYIE